MAVIRIPTQRSAPESTAVATAVGSGVGEPGWGALLRVTAARAGLAMVASLVLWSLLPALLGFTPRVILSGSMEPRIHSGDVIVTREVPAASLVKGQVLTVTDPDHADKTRTHRLVRRDAAGDLVLKGDANQDADSSPVSVDAVLGLGVIRVPFVGRPAYWIAERSWAPLGLTFALLGLCAICAFPGRRHEESVDEDDSSDAGSGPTSTTGTAAGGGVVRSGRGRRVAAAVAVSVVAVGALGSPADAAFKRTSANATSVLNAASTFYPYRTAVLADSPHLYWRLAETTGIALNDTGAGNRDATLVAQTFTMGQAGALASETRDRSLGLTIGALNANTSVAGPNVFSVEAWFRSSSTSGGRIFGFGNGAGQNPSTTVDRQLYLAPNGRVMFGVGGATKVGISSNAAVNNGAWHHVVGTYTGGTNGMKLYVDGALQGSATATPVPLTGYWRAGAEQLTGWPSNPTDLYYEGSLDELAVYTTALSATRVLAHYNAGKTP